MLDTLTANCNSKLDEADRLIKSAAIARGANPPKQPQQPKP